jgi:hypothetical protein
MILRRLTSASALKQKSNFCSKASLALGNPMWISNRFNKVGWPWCLLEANFGTDVQEICSATAAPAKTTIPETVEITWTRGR